MDKVAFMKIGISEERTASEIFPIKFRELRLQNGLTQKQLADELGWKVSALSMIERGESRPTLDKVVTVAKFFSVTSDYLLGLSVY